MTFRFGHKRVLWIATAVSVIAAWSSFFGVRYLAERESRERLATKPPYPLAGAALDLRRYLTEIEASSSVDRPDRALVLYYSESCHVCRRNSGNWESLVKSLTPVAGREVWFVTADRNGRLVAPVMQEAREHHLSLRVFRVTEPVGFRAATGFSGTPITAVLDGDGGLRAIAWGNIQQYMAQLIAAWRS